jgi:hypothetical protein
MGVFSVAKAPFQATRCIWGPDHAGLHNEFELNGRIEGLKHLSGDAGPQLVDRPVEPFDEMPGEPMTSALTRPLTGIGTPVAERLLLVCMVRRFPIYVEYQP